MDLNSILTIIGIISPFVLSGVWVSTMITRISNRALKLELAKEDHKLRIEELEKKTSYKAIEEVVEKSCKNIFNSKEFRDSMKESIEVAVNHAVKETMLHIEKNKSRAEASVFQQILELLERNNKNENN